MHMCMSETIEMMSLFKYDMYMSVPNENQNIDQRLIFLSKIAGNYFTINI